LLQWAIWWASIIKRWSQVLENIECPRSNTACAGGAPGNRRSSAFLGRAMAAGRAPGGLTITAGYRLVTPGPTAEWQRERAHCRNFRLSDPTPTLGSQMSGQAGRWTY
jgi:hypothetical protein